MAQGRPRDPRKKHQWQQWVREWQASGLTVWAFCARHRLSEARFYAWRRQLHQQDVLTRLQTTLAGKYLHLLPDRWQAACQVQAPTPTDPNTPSAESAS